MTYPNQGRIAIDKPGRTVVPFRPAKFGFAASFRVTVPEDVKVSYGARFTLDGLSDAPIDWIDDPHVEDGSTTSETGEYGFPISAMCIDVERIEGGAIYLTVLQAGA